MTRLAFLTSMLSRYRVHFSQGVRRPFFHAREKQPFLVTKFRQWGAVGAEIKALLARTQSLNVFPLKLGVGQCIAIHVTLTARDFFCTYFYPSGPFTCIFSKASPDFFPVLAVANTGSCVGLQNEIGDCWMQVSMLSAR